MYYYFLRADVNSLPWSLEDEGPRMRRRSKASMAIASCIDRYYNEYRKKSYLFVKDVEEDAIELVGVFKEFDPNVKEKFLQFLGYLKVEFEHIQISEITFEQMSRNLQTARMNCFLHSDDTVYEDFELGLLTSHHLHFDEYIFDEMTQEEIEKSCQSHPFGEELLPEIHRIYQTRIPENVFGHPVHYIMESDDQTILVKMGDALVAGLYANGRLKSRRYTLMEIPEYAEIAVKPFDALYKSLDGGAIFIEYGRAEADEEEDLVSSKREAISKICHAIKKYHNQVLTILCFPRECTHIRELFEQYLGNQCMITFREKVLSLERSQNYLKKLACEKGFDADEELLGMVKADQKYYASDLEQLCEAWFDQKLKKEIFTSYQDELPIEEKKEEKKESEYECAYDSLMSMVGLTKAKEVINKALDYAKAQRVFASKGMAEERFSMHMVFTGNPGTAKTTAARLFAQIMKENEILTKGSFLEVGRADLVGKYVGWTAQIIKDKFKKAKGGVLFIDEAYSLVDDRGGSYGDEAINTIVQEMENHRKDVIVIFAGYPDKMEEFLNRNPGLRSRIAFHVPFDDYNTEELCQIADLMVKEKKLHFSPKAQEKLRTAFEHVCGQHDFGNGRYVRNLVEQSRMNQASRLVHMEESLVTQEVITTITEEDIEVPAYNPKLQIKSSKIGFRMG